MENGFDLEGSVRRDGTSTERMRTIKSEDAGYMDTIEMDYDRVSTIGNRRCFWGF